MIDTDKYEGHYKGSWANQYGDVVKLVYPGESSPSLYADQHLITDAPLLLEGVKHLRMIYEELYLDWRKVWDILDNMGMAKEMRQHFPNTFLDTMELVE